MAYPAYPLDKLPYPVRDNFSNQYGTPFARIQMDDAHGRMRRKFGMLPFSYTINWYFTFEQLKWFEAFVKYDCAQASGFFTMPLNASSAVLTLRFQSYPDIAFDPKLGVWVVTGAVEIIRAIPSAGRIVALPTFPSTLPTPEKSNYSIKRADTVSRSNIPAGLASEHARFTDEVALVTLNWYLTADEYATFDNFVHNSLFGGLAPFTGTFSNGLGTNPQRMNFVETPKVAASGSCYSVSAVVEIRDIPTISKFDYRGLGKLNLTDNITYIDDFVAEIGEFSRDILGYAATVKFKVGKAPTDSVSYSESITRRINAKRILPENVNYSEAIKFKFKKSPLTETIVFHTNGQACYEDYASDWVQFGYDQLCNSFGVESVDFDSISFTEQIRFGLTGHRIFAENATFSATGSIMMNTYVAPDYVEFGYTANMVATL